MKDCSGGQHPDNSPVTWWEFERELAHRDRLADQKEQALRAARELRDRQMLLSHRIVVAVITIIGILVQFFHFLR